MSFKDYVANENSANQAKVVEPTKDAKQAKRHDKVADQHDKAANPAHKAETKETSEPKS